MMKKINILILKWAKDLNRLFSKDYVQIASREMQIKSTIRYHLKPPRMAIIKKADNNKCW